MHVVGLSCIIQNGVGSANLIAQPLCNRLRIGKGNGQAGLVANYEEDPALKRNNVLLNRLGLGL